MNICVYGASSQAIDPKYLSAAQQLGGLLAERGHRMIFGGGATGVMGAAAVGAHQKGGKITGIAPSFFDKPGVLYKECDRFIFTQTMRERKQLMEESSDAFIVAAGGIGTFEEFFEILTLKQLGRHTKPIALLNTDGYYDEIEALLKKTVKGGFMPEKNLGLCRFFPDAESLLDYIEKTD